MYISPKSYPQKCYGCNVGQGGRYITFRENLVEQYGETMVLVLEGSRNVIKKYSDQDLINKIDFYTKEVQKLL